jgi:ribosomal protein L21E
MSEFHVGDRVRTDIPDETDPDHERYHGEYGQIVDISADEAGTLTSDDRDSTSTEYSSAPMRRSIFVTNQFVRP